MLRTLLIPILLLLTPLIGAQDPFESNDRLTVKAHFEPASAKPGDEVTLIVDGDIEDGFHIYGALDGNGNPTTATILEARGLKPKGDAIVPFGHPHDTLGVESFWIEGKVKITQKFTVPADAANGVLEISGEVDYMACTVDYCDPAGTAAFAGKLEIQGGAEKAAAKPAEDSAPADDFGMQDPFGMDEQKVSFELRFEPATARAGEKVTLHIKTTVIPEWHVYGGLDENPITFNLDAIEGLTQVGTITVPDGHRHAITEDFVNYWIEGEFEVTQVFTVGSDVKPGAIDLKGLVEYMACDLNSCDPPGEEAIAVTLTIDAGEARSEAEQAKLAVPKQGGGTAAKTVSADEAEEEEEGSSIWTLIAASFFAGIFALVMPCTYPMIPITISFFTKQAHDRHSSVLPLALIYGLGIILMFIVIGVLAAPIIVPFATHWVTNLFIALLFITFALSLFGLFTLQPPAFLMNAAGKASSKGGYFGVFLMGATLVITSFTCTAPFVGTLLALAAPTEVDGVMVAPDFWSYARIATGMGVFGLTMATPFVFLSLVPGKLKAMPRSGEWMNIVKVFLGFVEIAAAMKFLSNVDLVFQAQALPRELFLFLWFGIFTVAGMFLLGIFKLDHDTEPRIGAGRMVGGLCSMLFAAYCLFGGVGNRMDNVMTAIIPNYSNSLNTAGGSTKVGMLKHTVIKDDFEAAMALAALEKKLVMINFTGHT